MIKCSKMYCLEMFSMFIREYKTKNKKTDKIYKTHKLVESIRTEKGPRQRIVMGLGTLTLPKKQWKKLAAVIETKLTGQTLMPINRPTKNIAVGNRKPESI